MKIWAIVWMLVAVLIWISAKSAIHEIEAGIAVLISTVAMAADSINACLKEILNKGK